MLKRIGFSLTAVLASIALAAPAHADPITGTTPFPTSQIRTVSTAGGAIHLTEVRVRHPLHFPDGFVGFTRWTRWHVTSVAIGSL